jgi:undecaprenyl-diphosphatase
MIETFVNFDHSLFLALNGMHNEFMDAVMQWIADRFIWIPLYVLLAVYLYRKFGKQAFVMIFFGGILVLISDQSSVLIKNIIERPRPCHNESLSFFVHTVNNKCGGQFGFVSSHAANTMGLLCYMLLLTRNSSPWLTKGLVIWVVLLGYCRVYLGVHFPADIAGGWIVGIISSAITYVFYRLMFDSPNKTIAT